MSKQHRASLMGMNKAQKIGETWWNGTPPTSQPHVSPAEPESMRPPSLADLAPLLETAPLSESELPPTPICPICEDSGWVKEKERAGHPNFGKLSVCACRQAAISERDRLALLDASNLGAYGDKTFAEFNARAPGVGLAYGRALTFSKQPCGFLVLAGGFGVGKTHLAAAIANAAVQQRQGVYFATVPDMLDELRAGYGSDAEAAGNGRYEDRMRRVREVSLLVLDDLGTETTNGWTKEKLFQIVNHRYTYELSTVVTLNRRLEEIDPRLVSRLSDTRLNGGGIIKIDAADYRQRTAQKGKAA